jgi:pilus assembly protein CpaB
MRGRALIPLVVGLGVGLVALKVFVNVLQKAKAAPAEMVSVVYATGNIEPTLEIQESMVEVRQVPKGLAGESAFREKSEVVGRVASWPIPKGSPIADMQLAAKGTPPGMAVRIPEGYRAVAVKIDESAGVAGWIKPSSRVDVVVLLASPDKSRESISKTILQNVEVLAVGQDLGKAGDTAAALTNSATLLVRSADVPKLHLAETKGKLRLAMRNQRDAATARDNTTTDNDLLTANSVSQAADKPKGPTFLDAIFGAQAKPKAPQTDKDLQPAPVAVAPAEPVAPPPPQPWTVEVLKGPDGVESVRFERHGEAWDRAAGQERAAVKPAASPAPVRRASLLPGIAKPVAPENDGARGQAKGPEPEGPVKAN